MTTRFSTSLIVTILPIVLKECILETSSCHYTLIVTILAPPITMPIVTTILGPVFMLGVTNNWL